jgi:hypothetical protein
VSYLAGEVSFWRPGAPDWTPAQLNIPLAPGDELYTGNAGNLELQVGTRAFVRAWGDTQLGLANQEPDFLQVKVTGGHVALDLRSLDPGRTVELDTPAAAFTVERPGYYRVDVTPERTSFITRRGGRATMTLAGGPAVTITPSEEIVLEGAGTPVAQSYVAPELDTWDRWNYARTDDLLESISARYVSADVYGVDDLDHYGSWRVVPTYGSVWVPQGLPGDWVPYSTGKWIWDPYYGWTWVDTAPWGWAPYHHGRWVFVDGFWAWAPGPVVARAVYAPALVAFFGAPGVRVAVGAPTLSWVALSWGEPLVPWWGPAHFVGRPWWGGWGGPRVVNNVVVSRTTVVNVNTITVYKNVSVQHAVVAVHQDAFGRRPVREARVAGVDVRRLEPVRGAPRVRPEAASFVAATGHAVRPPDPVVSRPVVATRPPAGRQAVRAEAARAEAPGAASRVEGPRAAAPRAEAPRGEIQRQEGSRAAPPRGEAPRAETPREERPRAAPPRGETPRPEASRAPAPRPDAPRVDAPSAVNVPAPHIVSAPKPVPPAAPRPRPQFGASSIERSRPTPPQFETQRPPDPGASAPREAGRRPEPAPQARKPEPKSEARAVENPAQARRPLPGEPANRLFPGRGPHQPESGSKSEGDRGPR